MAFKMKRSMIKGTPAYKKTKAKVQAIDVAKGPTGPDANLVRASELLGSARGKTKNIDFTIKQPDFDFSGLEDVKFGKRKSKDKVEKTPRVKKDRLSLKDRLKNIKNRFRRDKFDEQEYYDEIMQETPDTDFSSDGSSESVDKGYKTWKQKEDARLLEEAEEMARGRKAKEDYERLMSPTGEIEMKRPELKASELKDKPKKIDELDYDADLRDRFERKAESLGYDLSTPVGYLWALKQVTYSEADDVWRGHDVTIGDVKATDPELEKLRIQQEKELEAKRLAKIERDKKRAKQEEKLRIKKEEDIARKERNQNIREAREYFEPGTKITQSKLDEYIKYKQESQEMERDFEEQYDLDPGEPGYEAQQEKYAQERTTREFVRRDEDGDGIPDYLQREPIGPSPAQMRDDRIFNGAIKGGKVQQNMLKSGYIPPNKR